MSANLPAEAQSFSNLTSPVAGDSAGRAFLLYEDGDETQRRFFFEPGAARATVGRGPSCDLPLDWDDQVSRLHARFELVGSDWELVDDRLSRNGTFVNEERVSGRRRLRDGDSLRFGTTTITFHSPEPEQAITPAPAGPPAAVSLSSTQRRVLVALCPPYKGRSGFASPASDQQIADGLFLSAGEVRVHLRVLRAKLGVAEQPADGTRVQLVEQAFAAGLISELDL